jgi:hypothetical protein
MRMKKMSKEDATNKICPFSLNGNPVGFCLAKECMAWIVHEKDDQLGKCLLIPDVHVNFGGEW